MKRTLISIITLLIAVNFISGQKKTTAGSEKFAKWQQASYFRGYNVLYEAPKTQQDFNDFKNYGGNLFQIQPDCFFAIDPPYGIVQSNIDGTDMLVNFCRVAGIHYVIGMRSGPGAYDTYDESQQTVPESRIWNTGNTIEQQKYAEMLQMIVQRYSNDTLFVGINLVIEPRPKVRVIPANTSSLYKTFLETVYNIHMDQVYDLWVSKIREVDPNIPIILESFGYSTPELFPPYEVNDPFIVYSAHDYQPNEYTKAQEPFSVTYPGNYWNITYLSQRRYDAQFIRETIFGKLKEFQESNGAPVFIGELGMIQPQTGGEQYLGDLMTIFKDYGWNYAIWDWRRQSGSNWTIELFNDAGNLHWKTVLSHFYAPPVPHLTFPVNGAILGDNPVFTWDPLTAFTTYDLEIMAPTGAVEQYYYFEDIQNPNFTYSENFLPGGFTYAWRVRSKNPGGAPENRSEWSNYEYFNLPEGGSDNDTFRKSTFSLGQNSPNPFNPSTTLNYQIQKNSFVKLVIFDMLGREVSKLVNAEQNEGTYSVLFNASDLSSGIYFYRLEAIPGDGSASFIQIKRMILVK